MKKIYVLIMSSLIATSSFGKDLRDEVKDIYDECMNKYPITDYLQAVGACKGISYEVMFRESNIRSELKNFSWLPRPGILSVFRDGLKIEFTWPQSAADFF